MNPNDRLVLSFEQAHALRGLDTLAASIDQSHTDNIVGLRLLVALLSMRHFEADYRVNQSEVSRQQFLMA